MLWAALFFPQLSIDMLSVNRLPGNRLSATSVMDDRPLEGQSPDRALAVVAQTGARRLVISSDATAREMGIHPGLALNSAYAIAPDLRVIDYDEQQQQRYIENLCLWALQYSSWVSPRLPNLVLVEVEASLKLFGGLEPLVKTIRKDLQSQGLLCQLGIAPTPAAASLFARIGGKTGVLTQTRLKPVLGEIPVEYLPLEDFTLKGLRQSGIKQCNQLFALPASALSRRFGQGCSDLVYKLLGTLPEVCPAFNPPETFSSTLDLPLEAPDAGALAFPLNRLLSALGGFLRSADLGVKDLLLTLRHEQVKATPVNIRLLQASADHRHLLKVIGERLANIELAAPVCSVTIDTNELAGIERDDRDLLQKSQSQKTTIEQLLENLEARLGNGRLYTPTPSDDHRPEKAWCSALLENNSPPSDWPARPVWLLRHPVRAAKSLQIKSSAERIENGWWGETDVRRDYYIAADSCGAHYWVYSERSTPDVIYIHGVFS